MENSTQLSKRCFFLGEKIAFQDNEDTFSYTIHLISCVFNVAFSLTATFGNLLIISAIWKTPSLQNPSNILFCCLASTDLGVGLIAQPSYAVYEFAQLEKHFWSACVGRLIADSVGWTLSSVTFLTIMTISVEKYLALRLHLRYKELVTTAKVITVFSLLWIPALLHALLRPWFKEEFWYKVFMRCLLFFCVGVAFIVTPFVYVKIFHMVRHHRRQICTLNGVSSKRQRQQEQMALAKYRKSVVANLMVLAAFYLSYAPFICVEGIGGSAGFNESLFRAYRITSVWVFINSTLNPILLYWRLGEIRKAVKRIVKAVIVCTLG